jgi:hypothetical protein
MDYPLVQQIQLSQRASIVVSQIQRHRVLIDVCGNCSQSINIYTIVVVATSTQVKV